MNNYRLSSNYAIKIDKAIILEKLNYLLSLPSPYEIKNSIRFLRGTDKLVSEKLNITVEDTKGNIQYFNSIIDCSLKINISRKIIKNCLITGSSPPLFYKNELGAKHPQHHIRVILLNLIHILNKTDRKLGKLQKTPILLGRTICSQAYIK
jgi:hypothetical protein